MHCTTRTKRKTNVLLCLTENSLKVVSIAGTSKQWAMTTLAIDTNAMPAFIQKNECLRLNQATLTSTLILNTLKYHLVTNAILNAVTVTQKHLVVSTKKLKSLVRTTWYAITEATLIGLRFIKLKKKIRMSKPGGSGGLLCVRL